MTLSHGTLAHRLIADHLVDGRMEPGGEIGLRIDQTLTQDATGTLVMQELDALGLDRVRTEVSVQYVDHNLLQADERNAEDHAFLRSACRRFGIWYSKPGNGVSHPSHMQYFGVPGRTLAGSDSHTCAAAAPYSPEERSRPSPARSRSAPEGDPPPPRSVAPCPNGPLGEGVNTGTP